MTEEQTLIRRVQGGDHEAFAHLMSRYEKQVYTLCLRMSGHEEDARDLTQEAFLKAWRGLRFYQFEASFSTWLYRLTSNVCIDFLRKQKRQNTVSMTLENEEGETEEQELPDPAALPEEQTIQREQKRLLYGAIQTLDGEFRLALTLRAVEQLSYEEIGEILNLKPGTVKSRIARARGKLRKILAEHGNFFCTASSNQEEGRDAL